MKCFSFQIDIKNKPELDPGFIPLYKFNKAFLKTAKMPFSFALERNDKQISVTSTYIHGDKINEEADWFYIDRLVKVDIWQKGGFRLYIKGDDSIYNKLKQAYAPNGSRSLDADFMGQMYQNEFEVVKCDELPEHFEITRAIGRNFGGCRIGFDAGGSDHKVSAVIDGDVVYSKETVWDPKINSDPEYHYRGIVSAFKDAMNHMPRVDAIGISSAGISANNHMLSAQLFQMIPKELFDSKVRDIYIRAGREIGENIPLEVANDGEVAALAGSISLNKNSIFGLAMGTSVAGGFVDKAGSITTWLNEIAFAPVDASSSAEKDSWSGDIGVAVQYFCQEAVIKLSDAAGISLAEYDTPAKKLKAVQNLLDEGHKGAAAIFRSIGVYLGHTAPLYYEMYSANAILLLGRVMSGKGGDIILETANTVLHEEYSDVPIELVLPDENTRRLGQSFVAASLPKIK